MTAARSLRQRSTRQIEEGPVDYSIAIIDGGVVTRRIKALDPFPFVVIVAPADHRLMRGPDQIIVGESEVRALVFGARPIRNVYCRIGDAWVEMTRPPEDNLWVVSVTILAEPLVTLTVRAVDGSDGPRQHTIAVAAQAFAAPVRLGNVSMSVETGPQIFTQKGGFSIRHVIRPKATGFRRGSPD